MQTAAIETWTGDPTNIGPMYPFVGLEVPLFVVCVVGAILYVVWQLRFESRTYQREEEALAGAAELRTSIVAGAPDCYEAEEVASSSHGGGEFAPAG